MHSFPFAVLTIILKVCRNNERIRLKLIVYQLRMNLNDGQQDADLQGTQEWQGEVWPEGITIIRFDTLGFVIWKLS